MRYKTTQVYAQKAVIEETENTLYLKGGFYSEYLENTISGTSLIYNPFSNYFVAEDVTVKSKRVISQAEQFSYMGEKIRLKKAHLGVSLIRLDIDFGTLDIYPGWVVAQDTVPYLFDVPFWYIPTIVEDKRRNSYKLPAPLPEAGDSSYRGEYWRWNTHYYMNEWLYGNVQFGRSQEKGAGYGFQQIVRFSDYDQFMYSNDNWQYDRTQEVFSFEHSFLELPRNRKRKMSFNELLRFNEEVRDLEANSLQINKTRFEEINEEIIHRDPELIYEGNFILPWYDLHFRTVDSYAKIEEVSTKTRSRKISLLQELERKTQFGFLGEFTPGVGYDTQKYSIDPYDWHRLYDYVKADRAWWIFNWQGKVTDYLDDRGGSPFMFDKKYELSDNVLTKSMVRLWALQLGQSTRYSIQNGKIFDIIYHLKYTTSSWALKIDHSLRRESWSAGIEMNIM